MADKKATLGPGAKGDPENPESKTDLTDATATEVIEAVESGEVSRDEALEAEKNRDGGTRKTVVTKLKESE